MTKDMHGTIKRAHARSAWMCCLVLIAGFGATIAEAQQDVTPPVLTTNGRQLVVPLYQSKVLSLGAPAKRVSVGNPDIADILILRSTQLYVLGKDLGTTNVLVWDASDRLIGTVNVEVVHDLDSLKQKLHELLPNESIEVHSVQHSIVLSGQVSSVTAMNAALQVAKTYLGAPPTTGQAPGKGQSGTSTGSSRNNEDAQVINLMQVGGVQQVMLEVKVAEINRSELKSMNAQFNGINHNGGTSFGGVNGGASFPDAVFNAPVNGRLPVFDGLAPWGPAVDEYAPKDMTIGNQGLFASFLSRDSLFNMALDIAKEHQLAKILAEPTLTTLTGEKASFLSGGQIAIPVPQNDFRTTFEFKDFGVKVEFLPVVLGSGLINLRVDVTVSEVASINPGSLIPLQLGTRRATSTVELREGQTMGLAGLINDNTREAVRKFPGLGAVPVLGALFRSQNFRNDKSELVITVTPHLAKPMAPGSVRLPTDTFTEPDDSRFYILGKLEGAAPTSGSKAGSAAGSAGSATGSAEKPAAGSAAKPASGSSDGSSDGSGASAASVAANAAGGTSGKFGLQLD